MAWHLGEVTPRRNGLAVVYIHSHVLVRQLGDMSDRILVAVDAAVARADALTQRLWARAAFFPRNDPLVLAVAQALGKSAADLDDIFRLAATK